VSQRYAVIGNPILHSKSPLIHALFARETAQDMVYDRIEAALDDFAGCVRQLQQDGIAGVNVTVPFKEQAYALADWLTDRARLAGAVNTLKFTTVGIEGDNTDGEGLVTDMRQNIGFELARKRILVMGAGGAARGVILPLLAAQPGLLVIANRSARRVDELRQRFQPYGIVESSAYSQLAGMQFDVIINATSASLADQLPPLPRGCFAPDSLAYDMMYGKGDTPFLNFARHQGAAQCADGLGMLVEQAAAAFYFWRRVRPATAPVIAALRTAA
jgi:shikimate dehydrogenase